MTATEIPVIITLPPPDSPRTEGIHVSSIIRCLATEAGILNYEQLEDLSLIDARNITDQRSILRMNIGLAWEKHYAMLCPDVSFHAGELELDGIFMTPDGESVSVVGNTTSERYGQWELIVVEYKATYKSTNTVGDLSTRSSWMWRAQLLAYCKAKGTRFAKLAALFICGDYSYPIGPTMKEWLIEFTQEEIDANWRLMCDYRDYQMND